MIFENQLLDVEGTIEIIRKRTLVENLIITVQKADIQSKELTSIPTNNFMGRTSFL
jgi:hypothetical protein